MMRTPEDRNDAGRSAAEDQARARQIISARLSALDIRLDGSESPELLERIAEAVERFESAVESRGGDLMLDEPPRGSPGQPDNADFVLPRRRDDEAALAYLERLEEVTRRVLSRPPTD